jgi:hypothetical protein
MGCEVDKEFLSIHAHVFVLGFEHLSLAARHEARSHYSRCLYVLTECTTTLSIAEVASGFLILKERSGAERRRDLEMAYIVGEQQKQDVPLCRCNLAWCTSVRSRCSSCGSYG